MRTGVVQVVIADQVDPQLAHLPVTSLPVTATRQRAGRAWRRRRSLVQQTAQLALVGVRHVRLDVDAESVDAVDGFLQLVGLGRLVGRRLR